MREIKFRVFDKRFSRMYEWPININHYVDDDDFILQQYTGIKTYDGKEIYEGDIVKTEYTSIPINNKNEYGEPHDIIQYGVVVFDEINDRDDFYTPPTLAWCFKVRDLKSSLLGVLENYKKPCEDIRHHFKILYKQYALVGNICENKDLILKEKECPCITSKDKGCNYACPCVHMAMSGVCFVCHNKGIVYI